MTEQRREKKYCEIPIIRPGLHLVSLFFFGGGVKGEGRVACYWRELCASKMVRLLP